MWVAAGAKALKKGWPIATGIIGACRHIVKDRMDNGRTLGLEGAEAILRLRLRALIASGDFDAYLWRYHLRREHERIHHAKYRETCILAA